MILVVFSHVQYFGYGEFIQSVYNFCGGAVVKNSILMQDSYISQNAKVNCAILDKNVVVKPGREISGAETYPIYIGKDITV